MLRFNPRFFDQRHIVPRDSTLIDPPPSDKTARQKASEWMRAKCSLMRWRVIRLRAAGLGLRLCLRT